MKAVKQAYFQGSYPANHWALQPYRLTDPKVIAIAHYKNSQYALYLNPKDKRGYYAIGRLIDNRKMLSVMNREYTSDERRGLALLQELSQEIFDRIVPITQISILRNNSHQFDPKTRILLIGNANHPSSLHFLIYGRGDPKHSYIPQVPLDGPIPGLPFDLMAKSEQAGNKEAVHWTPNQMTKAISRLRSEILNIKEHYAKDGLVITIPTRKSQRLLSKEQ